jgi:parallel beta-helix repeat protein
VVLYHLNITDILSLGVDAVGSVNSGIESSQIKRTMNSAIAASHFGSIGFHAYDNLLTDIGVTVTNGQVTSLPSTSAAAIDTGLNSNIRNNAIYRTGNIGIYPLAGSSVSNNYIENACMVTDDCGAIYTSGADSTGITIANNTINHVVGGLAGKPVNIPTQAQGIYLDELASGNTISGNTVVDADNGVQIHNAANNLIQNNTFYANRLHHVWLQEGSSVLNSGGDIHDNSVLSNRMFLTSPSPAVFQQTLLQKTDTNRFAQYNYNRYFTFLYPTISTESWPVGSSLYTLPKWQTAVTPNTVPRSLDINGTEVNSASLGYAAFLTLSGNIVPNGNFSTGTYGWSSYSAVSPAGKMTLGTCTTVGTCLTYTSGGSPSLMNSPNFSVQASQWYKVTFDLKTGASGQTVYVVVRRGGGGSNGYEWLMNAPYQFVGTTGWQRYSFLFKSSETIKANDPLTGDLGARVDFEQMQYGQNVSVGNLEIVSLSAVDATLHSNILLNPTISAMNLNCPDGSLSATCNQYVRFSDNQPVIWPYTLQPYSSEIIYTRDSKLIDADGDGIPDSQDKCSATPALQAVNAAGCALGQ